MNRSRRNVQPLGFRSKAQVLKLSQAVRWLQEWPTVESLIYGIYPAIRQRETMVMEEAIDYLLEELDSPLSEDQYQPHIPRSLDRDAAAMTEELARIFHWFEQWEIIEAAIYEAQPDINRTVMNAFGKLLPCIAEEISAAVRLYEFRKQLTYRPPTA